jgi:hypothetical protein
MSVGSFTKEETTDGKKRFPAGSRKHEQPVEGTAKARTTARVVTQAAPSNADKAPSKKPSIPSKHKNPAASK